MASLEFETELVQLRDEIQEIRSEPSYKGDREARIRELEFELKTRTTRIFENLSPWDRVQLARHTDRPHTLDFVDLIFTDFVELHGGRRACKNRKYKSHGARTSERTKHAGECSAKLRDGKSRRISKSSATHDSSRKIWNALTYIS